MNKKTMFAIGTGRCGTKFLYELFAKEAKVSSHHERHPLSDTFHRYCKWYDLPIDKANFLAIKTQGIATDLAHSELSFESSAFLSFAVEELYQDLDAKIVLLVRNPVGVVSSYWTKGWYKHPIQLNDAGTLPSYYETQRPHHFFGRTLPKGEAFEAWNRMTRVGKLAWFWKTLNLAVIKQFNALPSSHYRVQRLEDLDYQAYCNIATFAGFDPQLSERKFNKIRKAKPNSKKKKRTHHDWTKAEITEFMEQIGDSAQQFGYSDLL